MPSEDLPANLLNTVEEEVFPCFQVEPTTHSEPLLPPVNNMDLAEISNFCIH